MLVISFIASCMFLGRLMPLIACATVLIVENQLSNPLTPLSLSKTTGEVAPETVSESYVKPTGNVITSALFSHASDTLPTLVGYNPRNSYLYLILSDA